MISVAIGIEYYFPFEKNTKIYIFLIPLHRNKLNRIR